MVNSKKFIAVAAGRTTTLWATDWDTALSAAKDLLHSADASVCEVETVYMSPRS